MQPNDAGELEGTATGTFTLDGEVQQGACSFEYATSAAVTLELTAEGKANGPYTVEAVEGQDVDEVQRHRLCNTPVDLQIQWEIGLNLENVVFRDGRYEHSDEGSDIVLFYFGR